MKVALQIFLNGRMPLEAVDNDIGVQKVHGGPHLSGRVGSERSCGPLCVFAGLFDLIDDLIRLALVLPGTVQIEQDLGGRFGGIAARFLRQIASD